MTFSRYNSFPIKFGSRKPSKTKAIVEAISDKLSYAYTDDENSFSWAEIYCMAKAFEYLYRANQAATNNSIPGKATFSLSTWERIFGISPNKNISETERRKVLAAKWLNLANDLDYLENVCKKIYGNSFNSISVDHSIQYWENNPAPEPGYDWYTSSAILLININQTSKLNTKEYDRKKTILAEILNDIIAIYSTYYISFGDYFKAGIGRIGYNPLG